MARIHGTIGPRYRSADQTQTREFRTSCGKVLHGKQQQLVWYHVVSKPVGWVNWHGARDQRNQCFPCEYDQL